MIQHRRKILLGVIVPIILGMIIAIVILQEGRIFPANAQAKTPMPDDPVLASLNREINQLDNSLLDDNLSPEDRRSILAKKNYFQEQATERIEYLSHQEELLQMKLTVVSKEKTSPPSLPTVETQPTPPEGLFPEFWNIKYREAHFTTCWLARTEKGIMLYYAGYLVDDPDQGIVYIEKEDGWAVEKYKAPGKDGSLKISKLDKDKNRLYLDTKKGKKYIFNTEKKKFVDEQDYPLPEAILSPEPAYPPPGNP